MTSAADVWVWWEGSGVGVAAGPFVVLAWIRVLRAYYAKKDRSDAHAQPVA